MTHGNIGRATYKVTDGGCHACTSHKCGKDGYPYIKFHGKTIYVSRYVYELCNGPISNGMVVRHTCDNPACINPEHLVIGTHADNVADRVERDRSAQGERNGRHKLSSYEVLEIYFSTDFIDEIASKYNVSIYTVKDIRNKKSWMLLLKDLPEIPRRKSPYGARNGSCVLNEQDVLEIYSTNESNKTLANKFGVTESAIYQIKKGVTWKHLTHGIKV